MVKILTGNLDLILRIMPKADTIVVINVTPRISFAKVYFLQVLDWALIGGGAAYSKVAYEML